MHLVLLIISAPFWKFFGVCGAMAAVFRCRVGGVAQRPPTLAVLRGVAAMVVQPSRL